MGNYERITDDKEFDGFARTRHEFRYKIAGSYVNKDDIVIDAACGTGYGQKFFHCLEYHGVDREQFFSNQIIADLNTWKPSDSFIPKFDVFVSIETIEHLKDWKHLLKVGRQATRLMIVSTPIIPTKHFNEFHINDFTKEELDTELQQEGWIIEHYQEQDNEYGIWILTK